MIQYRWLGTNGLHLRCAEMNVLVDPFLTRPSAWQVLMNRPATPNLALLQAELPKADMICVTHAHYDHLMDVPALAMQTGAQVLASANACRLLAGAGVPESQLRVARVGERILCRAGWIQVTEAAHPPLIFAPLVNGNLPKRLHSPLRLWDFKMDVDLGFWMHSEGQRLLIGNGIAEQADVIFMAAYCPLPRLEELLRRANPRRVVLIHWDDFTRPLSAPLKSLPGRLLHRDVERFTRVVQAIAPQVEVTRAEAMRWLAV